MRTAVVWFRRDLRLSDNPALLEAIHRAGSDGEVVPFFCLDDRLRGPSGPARLAYLSRTLRSLDETLDGHLVVRAGAPATEVLSLAREVGADTVVAAEDFGPYGRSRDDAVGHALESAGIDLELVDSPYAVAPGRLATGGGTPFKVFTPFSRAWLAHGWARPLRAPTTAPWATGIDGVGIPAEPPCDAALPEAGEAAAKRAARRFWDARLDGYADGRDRPGIDATSRLSPHLKWGTIHPRQLLAELDGRNDAHATFRAELCWREFYADVLFHRPDTVRQAFVEKMRPMRLDTGKRADERFAAWAEGRTGYPIVDAGMRQLAAEAWMHNRVRMIVASFLVKDLHLDWGRGARFFMHRLVDGDLASNHHGWQWTAGTGTDASPYFRIFNPVSQGEKFDPDGSYVRRWVPELADVPKTYVHHPWDDPDGLPAGYPPPIVDHAEERAEALRRYDEIRASG